MKRITENETTTNRMLTMTTNQLAVKTNQAILRRNMKPLTTPNRTVEEVRTGRLPGECQKIVQYWFDDVLPAVDGSTFIFTPALICYSYFYSLSMVLGFYDILIFICSFFLRYILL
jgi:hypothetical protein